MAISGEPGERVLAVENGEKGELPGEGSQGYGKEGESEGLEGENTV